MWTIILEQRFEILHCLLHRTIESRRFLNYNVSVHDIQTIRNLTELYHNLISISREVNILYSLPLFVRISLLFTTLLGSGYSAVYLAIFTHFSQYQICLNQLWIFCGIFLEAFLVVNYTTHMCNKVRTENCCI